MLHNRLSALRALKGLSQAELADQLNISRQAYSLYEINKRQMNFDTLCRLADHYGVSADYILGRQEAIPSFLNDEERSMIDKYRELDERSKGSVKNCLDYEFARRPKL
jgi:transcriptional regulator with XRE-family HTH domain